MQAGQRVSTQHESVRVDEAGDVDHGQGIAKQVWGTGQLHVEFVECDTEFQRRAFAGCIGKPFASQPLVVSELFILAVIEPTIA